MKVLRLESGHGKTADLPISTWRYQDVRAKSARSRDIAWIRVDEIPEPCGLDAVGSTCSSSARSHSNISASSVSSDDEHPRHGTKQETFDTNAVLPHKMTDGHSSAKLPQSIFSAGLIVLLAFPPTCPCFLKNYLPVYWSLLLTIAIQGWTTMMIRALVLGHTEMNGHDCSEGDALLRFVCTVVYVVILLHEMKESFYICVWSSRISTLTAGEPWEKFKMRKFGKLHDDNLLHTHCKVTSRMPLYVRWITWIVILIPKVAITFGLLIYGTGYVLRSRGNEALILNSVALTFITQVDDAFYHFTLLDRMKDWLDDMPESSLHPDERQKYCGTLLFHLEEYWAMYMNVLLVVFVVHPYNEWCGGSFGTFDTFN